MNLSLNKLLVNMVGNKYEQQIDDFLFGRMNPEEESLFLEEVKTNSELREEATMTALLVKALRET